MKKKLNLILDIIDYIITGIQIFILMNIGITFNIILHGSTIYSLYCTILAITSVIIVIVNLILIPINIVKKNKSKKTLITIIEYILFYVAIIIVIMSTFLGKYTYIFGFSIGVFLLLIGVSLRVFSYEKMKLFKNFYKKKIIIILIFFMSIYILLMIIGNIIITKINIANANACTNNIHLNQEQSSSMSVSNHNIQNNKTVTDTKNSSSVVSNKSNVISDPNNSIKQNVQVQTLTKQEMINQKRQTILNNFLGNLIMQQVNLNVKGNGVGGNVGMKLYHCIDDNGNIEKNVVIVDGKGTKSEMVAQFLVLVGGSLGAMNGLDTIYLMNANGTETNNYVLTIGNNNGPNTISEVHIQANYKSIFQSVQNKIGNILNS